MAYRRRYSGRRRRFGRRRSVRRTSSRKRRYIRQNIEHQIIRGQFQWAPNYDSEDSNNNVLRLAINMNGLPGWHSGFAAFESPIKTYENGAIVANDTSEVSQSVLNICLAYDALYERRKISWIKLNFMPRFKTYQANLITNPSASAPVEEYGTLHPTPLYQVSDNYGLNVGLADLDPVDMFPNQTGVKMRRITSPFKVFRRGLRFPLSPRYVQSGEGVESPGYTSVASHPAGQWKNTLDEGTAAFDHLMIVSNPIPGIVDAAPPTFYDVMFQIKYTWYDKRSVYVAPT